MIDFLIDADSYVYRIAYHCQDLDEYDLKQKLINFMNIELSKYKQYGLTNNNYLLLLSDKRTFRYDIYPEYKANRKKQLPMLWINELFEIMKQLYPYRLIKNYEADDLAASYMKQLHYKPIIIHTDKDLLQIPGIHIFKNEYIFISQEEALEHLYTQIIQGDSTDNIKGIKGYGKVKAKLIIDNTSYVDLIDTLINLFIKQEENEVKGLQNFWLNYNLIKLKTNIMIND